MEGGPKDVNFKFPKKLKYFMEYMKQEILLKQIYYLKYT